MSTYKDLLAQKSALEAQIAKAQAERKAEGIAMANEVIKEYGLTADDVFPPARPGGKPSTVGVAKYRNPETGATWTGRGKPPLWILGKDRGLFAI